MPIKQVKLIRKKRNNDRYSFLVSISKPEAEQAGFVDDSGEPLPLVKIVEAGEIKLKRMQDILRI